MGVGEGEGDALVLADGTVEDDPVIGVPDSPTPRQPADAESLRCDEHPFGVEAVQDVGEAPSLFSDPVLEGHDHIQCPLPKS